MMESIMVLNDGTIVYMKDGKAHRDGDLPAMESPDGDQHWMRNGYLHRDGDLPAVVDKYDGYIAWYKHSVQTRDGYLPARIYNTGTKCWIYNNQMYMRFDGITKTYSVVDADGNKSQKSKLA